MQFAANEGFSQDNASKNSDTVKILAHLQIANIDAIKMTSIPMRTCYDNINFTIQLTSSRKHGHSIDSQHALSANQLWRGNRECRGESRSTKMVVQRSRVLDDCIDHHLLHHLLMHTHPLLAKLTIMSAKISVTRLSICQLRSLRVTRNRGSFSNRKTSSTP